MRGESPEGGMVHLLNAKGNFVKTILKKGQGPEEAMYYSAMKLYSDDLYLLVNVGKEVMRYSLKKRKFTDRFRLPDEIGTASDFEILDSNRFIFYKDAIAVEGEEYKLYVYNKESEQIEQKWLPLNKEATSYISFSQTDCLYKLKDICYFSEVFQKGIYEVNPKELKGYITFVDNKYTIPDNILYNSYASLMEFVDVCDYSPYIWEHRNLREGPHFITAYYTYNKKFHWNVIDKQKKESHSYSNINDDVLLHEEMPIKEYMYHSNIQGNIRYFSLSYDMLHKVMEKKKANGTLEEFAKRHKKIMQIYEHMSEDTNDIIVMFHEK